MACAAGLAAAEFGLCSEFALLAGFAGFTRFAGFGEFLELVRLAVLAVLVDFFPFSSHKILALII